MVLSGCKSKESLYKQAYLKAQEGDAQQVQQPAQNVETNVVVPMQTKVATQTQVMDNADNVAVRQESVSVVSGSELKNFSVVVGSFQLKDNAAGLQQTLKNQGYDARLVMNSNTDPVMYRVVATSFDTKAEAAASRNALMEKFPGAWLLYAK